jgi:hypothetical protein
MAVLYNFSKAVCPPAKTLLPKTVSLGGHRQLKIDSKALPFKTAEPWRPHGTMRSAMTSTSTRLLIALSSHTSASIFHASPDVLLCCVGCPQHILAETQLLPYKSLRG